MNHQCMVHELHRVLEAVNYIQGVSTKMCVQDVCFTYWTIPSSESGVISLTHLEY
jgi:hypothetical protein